MADYGLDISCDSDITPSLELVGGRALLMQALKHRLMTPRGGLFYDNDYGFDLRAFVNAAIVNPSAIAAGTEAECLKDNRVRTASVRVVSAASRLRVGIRITDGDGPFAFVLDVSAVSVELLRGQ